MSSRKHDKFPTKNRHLHTKYQSVQEFKKGSKWSKIKGKHKDLTHFFQSAHSNPLIARIRSCTESRASPKRTRVTGANSSGFSTPA